MSTDTAQGERLAQIAARLAEIEGAWWGVHTSCEMNPDGTEKRIIYHAVHRHAGKHIGYLVEDVRALLSEVAALRRTAEARDRALVDIRDTLRTAIEHHHECYGGRSEHFGVTLAYSEILEMHEELAAALAAPDGGE